MKYTILINQAGVVHEGLETKTDVIDWALLDYIFSWQQNPKADRFEGMTWLDYKHLIKEMPLLGLNKKQSVSDRIKKSKNLGLIDTIQHPTNKRIFVKTTSVYYRVCQFKGVRDDGQGVRENRHEEFVKTDIDTTINNSTINDSLKESAPQKPKISLPDYIEKATWDEWMTVRKKKGAVISETSTTRLLNTLALVEADYELRSHGITPNEAIAIAIEQSWKGLNIEWLHNRLKQQGGSNASVRKNQNKKDPSEYRYIPTSTPRGYEDAIDSTAKVVSNDFNLIEI